MGRKFLAVLAGVIVAGVVVFVGEAVGSRMFPSPPGMNALDPASLKAHAGELPLGAFIAVLVSWALGSFAGGFTASGIARGARGPAVVVGVILMAMGDANFFAFPHPLWVIVLSPVCFVPFAWLGGALATRER